MAVIEANRALLGGVKAFLASHMQGAMQGAGGTLGGAAKNLGVSILQKGGFGAAMEAGQSAATNLRHASVALNAMGETGVTDQVKEILSDRGTAAIGRAFGAAKQGATSMLPQALGGSAGFGRRMGTYFGAAAAGRFVTGGGINPLKRKDRDRMDIIGIPFL